MYAQDHKDVIAKLAKLFPKTFFEDPKQRVPLKFNIATDVEKQGCNDLLGLDVGAAIDYYTTHVGYQISTATPGTMRVDLDGRPISRVTEQEAMVARQKVYEINQQLKTWKKQPAQNGREPMPDQDRAAAVRKVALADQKRSSLAPAELLAGATKKLARATSLLESEDDEFRASFVNQVLKEAKADIEAVLARL